MTEYNGRGVVGQADLFCLNANDYTYEFEVKVAKSDLMGELNSVDVLTKRTESSLFNQGQYSYKKCRKLTKHSWYLGISPGGEMPWGNKKTNLIPVPNYFAFAVPEGELSELCLKYLEDAPYGIYVIPEKKDTPICIKKPKALHRVKASDEAKEAILKRASLELARLKWEKVYV